MKRHKNELFVEYFVILLSCQAAFSESIAGWTYAKGSAGPSEWYKKHEACGAQRQSPIALWKNDVQVDTSVPILKLENYDKAFGNLKLENNGHTIKIEIKNSQATISGGGLPGKYNFAQLHFHWGKTDNEGSEHTIGNKFYPAELHLVHIRDGLTLDQALNDSQGLAVLGVFYDINDVSNNTSLMPIIDEVDRVVEAKNSVVMKSPLKLEQLLPSDTSNFFIYNGSLTTPPCNEVVIWTIFTQPFTITTSQLEKFRSINVHNVDETVTDEIDFGQKMLFNHRLPQPLHGRTVLVRKELIFELPTKSVGGLIYNANIVTVAFLIFGSIFV